jgi:pimeloyl-ACP methyl ester carboxylesterase
LIRGVFLEDPALYVVQQSRFSETWFHAYFASLSSYLKDYHANGANFEEMVTYVGRTPVDEDHTWLDVAGPEAVRDRARQLHQMDPAILGPLQTGMLFGNDGPDELLARIQCPVHLLAAQFDLGGAMSAQDVQRAVAQMPHSTHAFIENAGHDIHLDQPEAFLRQLKQYLAQIH